MCTLWRCVPPTCVVMQDVAARHCVAEQRGSLCVAMVHVTVCRVREQCRTLAVLCADVHDLRGAQGNVLISSTTKAIKKAGPRAPSFGDTNRHCKDSCAPSAEPDQGSDRVRENMQSFWMVLRGVSEGLLCGNTMDSTAHEKKDVVKNHES